MNNPRNSTLVLAACLGFAGVALGAFGAHALKTHLSEQALGWWATGVQYHLVHAAVLLAIALSPLSGRLKTIAVWTLALGTTVFSGSLYTMALTGITALGAITPIGGLLLLAGWAALVWAGLKKR
jgi:uncharacterized membrane protein YgdD (TMEM256/DUF423 family)